MGPGYLRAFASDAPSWTQPAPPVLATGVLENCDDTSRLMANAASRARCLGHGRQG